MEFHHIGMEVLNIYAASHFYKQLGFQDETYLVLNGEILLFMKKEQLRLELIETGSKRTDIHICFAVKTFEELPDSGYDIIDGPIVMENGWETMFIRDCNGVMIEFLRLNEED